MEQIFLYSHGFTTSADDNGLFGEIASFFPKNKHIMFEYDDWDGDEVTAATFSERVKKLQEKYNETRLRYPNVEIDLICHSQGCNIAMLAQIGDVEKTIMLAPPMVYGSPEAEYVRQKNKNCTVLNDGTIIRNRSAGYKTIIKPEFFNEFLLLQDTQNLCNGLGEKTKLFIIDALKDDVVKKDYSKLNQNVIIKHVDANHDLKGADGERKELNKVLHEIFQFNM